MRIRQRSKNRLEKLYRPWLIDKSMFMRPSSNYDPNGLSAAEIMIRWEGRGEPVPLTTSEPELLDDYVQGKKLRDWHITEYKDDIKKGIMFIEDMVGLGDLLTIEDVIKVIGNKTIEEGKEAIRDHNRRIWELRNQPNIKIVKENDG